MASFRWVCDKCGSLHDTEQQANSCAKTCSQAGPECNCPAPRWNGPRCAACGKPMPRRKDRREGDW